MNDDLWNEYLQEYFAEMRARYSTTGTFTTTTGGTFDFDWSSGLYTFRTNASNECVEKFIV